ncbi:MAG: M20/M25/M40 family metallo-hydrolase [Treponema sp.]|jgi:putative aminopeptidase FrvX|nr:M20/M25/M40 family metallo-hydrolase [Treponema sp.]
MDEANMISMIGELSSANGAPGFEDEVTALLRSYCQGLGEMHEDSLRNLFVYLKNNRGNRPVIQLDAHSDEVAFMVQNICADGTLKFHNLGGWVPFCVPAHAVRVRTPGGYIPGIVASKPPHYMSDAEKNSVPKIADMVIDVGAVSREDAVKNFGVRIGEPVIPDAGFRYLKESGILYGKAFDCRLGCAALTAVMMELADKELMVDVAGAFSVQEEMGLRGARVTASRIKPAAAIVFEGSPADDTFNASAEMAQTALKKGPMLRHLDNQMITNPRFQRFALNVAAELGIPVQEGVRTGGSTNGASIHLSNEGVPVIVIGMGVRYAHTHYCYSSYSDFENAVKLGAAIIRRLSPELIEGF